MQKQVLKSFQQLQLGGVSVEVDSLYAALVVYATVDLNATALALQGKQELRRNIQERSVDGQKIFAAVFSDMPAGIYTMSWKTQTGVRTVTLALEAGKITQIGLGTNYTRPTKTITKYADLPAEPEEENELDESLTVLGEDITTGEQITVDDGSRCSGCYVIGTQGVGKSSLLESMIYQDLAKGYGVVVLDPHGQLIENIISRMLESHLSKCYLLDLTDEEYPFGFNIFTCRDIEESRERTITRNRVASIFDKIWPSENRGLLLPMLLQAVTETLIEHADSMTMADIPTLLLDANYRAGKVAGLRNRRLKEYWQLEYDTNSASTQRRETAPLRTRLNDWLSDSVITNILCQKEATIDIRAAIENHEVLLIKLPVEQPGYEHAAPIMGTMLLSQIYAATFSFQDIPEAQRPGFSLYIDEFQYFATRDTARLFTGARKYKIRQTLAHQTRVQLRLPEVETATLTANTIVSFKVVPSDSKELASLFSDVDLYPGVEHIPRLRLSQLEKHRNKAVSDFWFRYIRQWEQAENKSARTEWPEWNLGHGIVEYHPNQVRAALRVLEDLLYHAMLEKQLNQELSAKLIDLFLEWYNKEVAEQFINHFSQVITALINDPIGERRETNKAATEDYLIHLEKRHALASISQTTYTMKTLPLISGVSSAETARRIDRIQGQTRDKYCRSREEVEAELGNIDAEEQPLESDPLEKLARSHSHLALAEMRMHIEKFIDPLYEKFAPASAKSARTTLTPMVKSLQKQGILDESLTAILLKIIPVANRALHNDAIIQPEQVLPLIRPYREAIEALTRLQPHTDESTWARFEPLE